MIWTLTTVQQALLFGATILVTGSVSWALFIRPAVVLESGTALASAEAVVARLARAAAVVVLVAWLLRGASQLLAFRDPFAPLAEDVSLLLFQTFWGAVWMAQGGVAVALVAAFAWAVSTVGRMNAPIGPWLLGALASIALMITLSLSSHAVGTDQPAIAVTADALHVLAAGLWIGTLAVILIAARVLNAKPSFFAAQIRRFSPLALVSGGTLVLMGSVLSWSHVPEVEMLWTTTYGRLLSAKSVGATLILSLGFVNWRKGLPVVDTAPGAEGVRRRGWLEVGTAVAVVLITAVLVHTAKP